MQRSETKQKRAERAARPISEKLNKRLAAYALAAGAAGAGVLAIATPAQAGIVLNTAPINIGLNTTEYLTINGVHELSFRNQFLTGPSMIAGTLHADGLGGAGFILPPLAKSDSIGKGKTFVASRGLAINRSSRTIGGFSIKLTSGS